MTIMGLCKRTWKYTVQLACEGLLFACKHSSITRSYSCEFRFYLCGKTGG
jgi:hypothetical protein